MASTIKVLQMNDHEFLVRIAEVGGSSSHQVTLDPADYQRLTGGKIEPAELIKRSFGFLLAREPKESILTRFDLPVIGRYFPEFESEIKRGL